jgi:hypothetical protein
MDEEQIPVVVVADDGEEDASWSFEAVGLNGKSRMIQVERLCGLVRLLTPGDAPTSSTDSGRRLPSRFIWNREACRFEPDS